MDAPTSDVVDSGLDLSRSEESPVHARRSCGSFVRDAANFTGLVLGCIETKFLQVDMRLEALAEIYTMHSFALL